MQYTQTVQIPSTQIYIPPVQNTVETQTQQKTAICKFCLLTQQQSSQKLISPCGCIGSLKHVHRECIEKWMLSQIQRKQSPLAPNIKLSALNIKCKLCEKYIKFEQNLTQITSLLFLFRWISLFYFIKKVKYYICISLIGYVAMNYYFIRFFFKKIMALGSKLKHYSIVSFIILSLLLMLLQQTIIAIKWNKNNIQLSIPFLVNK